MVRDFELIRAGGEALENFQVGEFDLQDQFHLPDMKLYGREKEIEEIIEFAGKFAENDQSSTLVIGGLSGVGKSALIRHMFQNDDFIARISSSTRHQPILLTGKHDRIKVFSSTLPSSLLLN